MSIETDVYEQLGGRPRYGEGDEGEGFSEPMPPIKWEHPEGQLETLYLIRAYKEAPRRTLEERVHAANLYFRARACFAEGIGRQVKPGGRVDFGLDRHFGDYVGHFDWDSGYERLEAQIADLENARDKGCHADNLVGAVAVGAACLPSE